MWQPIGIPTNNTNTMMVAIINNDSPFAPEHIQTDPCVSSSHGLQDESKHSVTSFIINLLNSSTPSYVSPTITKPNGCNANDHDITATVDPKYHHQGYATRQGDTSTHDHHFLLHAANTISTNATTIGNNTALELTMMHQPLNNHPTSTTNAIPQFFYIPPPCYDINAITASIHAIDTNAITACIMANWIDNTPPPSSTNNITMTMSATKTTDDGYTKKATSLEIAAPVVPIAPAEFPSPHCHDDDNMLTTTIMQTTPPPTNYLQTS